MDSPTTAVARTRADRIPFVLPGLKRIIGLVFVLALATVNIIKSLSLDLDPTPSTYKGREIEDEETANPEQLLQDTSAQKPIAWLMTFPNSGTSYTSSLVATVTGTHTATNYGAELSTGRILNHKSTGVLTDNDIPVIEYNWVDWVGDSLNGSINAPTKGYILTKTHCGGYCFACSVKDQNETTINPRAFAKACATGQQVIQNTTISGQFQAVETYTDIKKVGRAVHIIRDPFDNVVARFHFHRKKMKKKNGSEVARFQFHRKKNDSETLASYPNTRDGFRKFCHDLGRTWRVNEEDFTTYNDLYEWIKDVPCHSDFFRYIQWHNLAFATTAELDIPSMTFHYENYSTDFNKTKDNLLQFLHQEEVNPPPSFISGKTYRHYYTKGEIYAISIMFDRLAHPETRKMTRHYF